MVSQAPRVNLDPQDCLVLWENLEKLVPLDKMDSQVLQVLVEKRDLMEMQDHQECLDP